MYVKADDWLEYDSRYQVIYVLFHCIRNTTSIYICTFFYSVK